MKKLVILILGIILATAAFSQTQKGYVKTKGRMVDGKLVPGEGLKGSVVAVKGRMPVLVNKESGEFSFPMRDEQFSFDSVKKKGYQLVDAEACARTYKYSNNPIYFVMETPEQQLQDKLKAERKIRRNLQKQLQKREDEIENLKAEQKLTDEEYRQALQKLYQDQENNEQLISDMAKRYSELDYDQLDEFNRKISEYILNGQLTKADSLLNTKGDINERVEQLKKHEEVNAKEREKLEKKRKKLEKSEALAKKEKEELANDCYRKFEIFKAQYLNDTAAYYIELRASLDTTNANWQYDAGDHIAEYTFDNEKALKYYMRGLRQVQIQYGEKSKETLVFYNEIGNLYYYMRKFEEAINNYEEAMAIYNLNKLDDPMFVAAYYNGFGGIYCDIGDYNKAIEYYTKSLVAVKSIRGEEDEYVAILYNNLGIVYGMIQEDNQSYECFNKALEIFTKIIDENNKHVAESYNGLGVFYSHMGQYEKSIECLNKALSIRKILFGENNRIINNETYLNLGMSYIKIGDYDKAIECYRKALTNLYTLYGENMDYHPFAGHAYNGLGIAYNNLNKYEKSLEYKYKALSIFKNVYGKKHANVALAYYNLGRTYNELAQYDKALDSFQKALMLYKELFGDEYIFVARVYNGMGDVENNLGNIELALDYFLKSLEIYKRHFGEYHPETKTIQNNVILMQQKLQESNNK